MENVDEIFERLKLERLEAEKKAWEAFAAHKYVEFGYYADKWRDLAEIIKDNAKSPFASVVKKSNARVRTKGLRFAILEK